jgi:hypothetical protein
MFANIMSIEGMAPRDLQHIQYYTYSTYKVPNCLFPNVYGTIIAAAGGVFEMTALRRRG